MIQPEEIREKAERLYPSFLKAWLEGDAAFFPHELPSNKQLTNGSLGQSALEVQRLREGSREVLGYGYTVEWQERRSREFGLNRFPVRIAFETQDDFLRLINKQSEFRLFRDALDRLRAEFPHLASWVRSNRRPFIECAGELEGLLHVIRYFRDNPRPNCFARELPVPMDTKFIERHERVLRQWLDIVLPSEAIRAGESHFGRRYGLQFAELHWLVRLLDPALQIESGFPCREFSIPLPTLANLRFSDVSVIIVENKVNLLTLPPISNTLALGGVGRAATDLRQVDWLRKVPITYWGDVDVEGLKILSAWRLIFPQTQSLFMDDISLDRFGVPRGAHAGTAPEVPPHLSDAEQRAFIRCWRDGIWLEQERIPQADIILAFSGRLRSSADGVAFGPTSAHNSR
jgi:hypothetical protein